MAVIFGFLDRFVIGHAKKKDSKLNIAEPFPELQLLLN
jgi:hypothetical protein